MPEARRKNAQLLQWLRAAAIAVLTWGGMAAMHVQPMWLSAAFALGAGLLTLGNSELGVLLALVGLCLPLLAAQPIVGIFVLIVAFVFERYLGGHGAVGFMLVGLGILGALFGPVWAVAALAGCLLGPTEGALAAAATCLVVESVGVLGGQQALTVVVTGGPTPAMVSFANPSASLVSTQWITDGFKTISGQTVGRLSAEAGRVAHAPALIAQAGIWALAAVVAGSIAGRRGKERKLADALAGAAAGVGVVAIGDVVVRLVFGLPMSPAAMAIALVSSLVVAMGLIAMRETLFARVPVVVTPQPRQVSMAAEDADVDELLRLIATAEDKLAAQHTSERVVLITDMKSFSRMTEEDGSVATAKAIQRHRDLLVPIIVSHHGCGKSTGGDGVVAAFESAADAIRAAVEGQTALAAHNASHDNEREVLVRMGIASGEVVLDNGGRPFIGAGLNLAARVMNLADGGQIFATGDVLTAGASQAGPTTQLFGDFELKNIASPVPIGEVLWSPGQQPRDPRAEGSAT
ncbi:MAG: adenylate/guanylate cyclase domain-containing protein [Coriobacteriia bacterium]|nr:adenylate/guanylate cyclase domain-containing protein [Coriobacteriia bacterium]